MSTKSSTDSPPPMPTVPADATVSPAANRSFSTKLLENHGSPVVKQHHQGDLQSWSKTQKLPPTQERTEHELHDPTIETFRGT